ncbi:putative WRKY transcription factor 53-like [Capsicum annuum]|jgi:hypothetical protein|nr:putative WRKY transcription factor 53-like [Capsicum annuum]KAF3652175.1 putative WRKY transcription factor 53-like [Capsicum annuum]
MTKLSVTVLFLLFTLSVARTPGNDVTHLKLPPGNDVILPQLPKSLPQDDVMQLKNDIIIPELPKILPESEENDVILPELLKTLPEFEDSTPSVHSVPVNLVRFRPINRRFRLRSKLPFRLCNHMKAESRRQIPFGNDMILSSKRNIDFDKFVYRIGFGVSQIPSDRFNLRPRMFNDMKIWKFLDDREKFVEMKLKHHHDQDNDHQQMKISKFLEDREKFGEMKLKHHHHHHHDHHHDHDNEDNDHEQWKMWKFLDDREKFGEMKLKHHHHHDDDEDDEDNDHEQKKISKFQLARENGGNFGEMKSKSDDDEAEKRSKLYGKHYEMTLRKRFRYNAGEEEDEKAKEETKWHKKEKKKGGFMSGIRKFLHHYFD